MYHEHLREYLGSVEQIAVEAGEFIRGESADFRPGMIEEKGVNDLVSYVDRQAEELIVKRLSALTPRISILGEEGGIGTTRITDREGWQWIVDPLDGTTNFVHGLRPFAVSIALVHSGIPKLGVIYEPMAREMFSAVQGGESTLNGKVIHGSTCKSVKNSLIATGFPYAHYDRLPQFMASLDHLMRSSHGMRRLGSAAIDLAYVAAGRCDAFYEYGLKPWDVAAGIIIGKQAGIHFSDFQGGQNYLYGHELLCATEPLFKEFRALITDMMKG